MHDSSESTALTTGQLIKRLTLLLLISGGVAVGGHFLGLDMRQCTATAVFLAIILGTLFFWTFRLAIAFLGIGVLIFT